jgi:adenine-specific DNA-methyltransferase
MARRKESDKKPIEQYDHRDKKRLNNPPVGLVTPETDKDTGQKKEYAYDPHLDPQLVWAGKAEHTSFKVPTVSLHVHERIEPRTIIEAVRKRNGPQPQLFFQFPEENPPLRDAIQFYKHAHNWSNRLIAGDSLLVMNSLLEKEGLAGQVQMVYIDPTCGSGTTAYVAEQWGRRWLTCDTSRVAITLAKQRLMTALFDYYELAHPAEGVSSGFKYKTVPHVTLKSIANNEPPGEETLYDQPFIDNSKARVTGPFTMEAVPAQIAVKPLAEIEEHPASDESIVRSGETLRQSEWRDELLKTGIRGKAGQYINFSRVEPIGGTRWLHADAETKGDKPERVVVAFGPEHAPIEKRQVESAIQEAQHLVPKPEIVVFAAFQFDPEAAKDIDETDWPGVALLKAQMDADLLTDDLKKKRSSNESFWLIGQPDVQLTELTAKELSDFNSKLKTQHSKLYRVAVLGFDYYNTRTGNIDSGGTENIAMWMLDTDYDGRSLYPRQVFFPMVDEDGGWARLARNLKAEIDQELIESYRGTTSLPFAAGDSNRIAVKIIDDRGIESLKILEV